ncbi:hypothetical protein CYY_009732 [Polysphondylium violaceum]|uniref:Rab GTPase n=1 Tax=Polysphondylium violaceum TaxID=133409 RepID=A0A8J4PLA3_9MYCE|nr:hypothetical protein CYY_009732 [Polysphondylium violaceum]
MATSISSCDITLKILVVGDPCVGKSSLVWRMSENIFPTAEQANITLTNYVKSKAIQFGKKQILLKFHDTVGQERFRTISRTLYSNKDIIILTYDATSTVSFDHLNLWYQEVTKYSDKNTYIVLASTKSDLPGQVSVSQGQQFAEQKGISFIETSSLNTSGVDDLLQTIVKGSGERLYTEENWSKFKIKTNEPSTRGSSGTTTKSPTMSGTTNTESKKSSFCQIL